MNGREILRRRLAAIEAAIAAHPLSSAPVKDVAVVVEKWGTENKEQISKELSERGLPSLDEIGRIQVRTMFSWWKLHRDRRSLLKKLGRSDDTV